ncbi:MAG: MmgE/PrpD family protein, partial [Sphingomonadales bacterium]|nr:MmgE/PrpD family protein [Sphingomonadales bacterium]
WEILNNTFKPYASCLMTHAPIDAARSLAPACRDRPIAAITVYVNPLLPKVAGIAAPHTALEGKFSTAFCVALGLSGYRATDRDFSAATVESRPLGDIARKVRLEVDPAMPKTAARMRVEFSAGGHVDESVPLALGNPENPMSEDDLKRKFLALVEPVLGGKADELFACLKGFRTPGSLRAIAGLTSK